MSDQNHPSPDDNGPRQPATKESWREWTRRMVAEAPPIRPAEMFIIKPIVREMLRAAQAKERTQPVPDVPDPDDQND